MAEYIEREALIKRANEVSGGSFSTGFILSAILNAPTADVVEVRHGKWLSAYEYALKIRETDKDRLDFAKADKVWKFCPYCEQQVKWLFNYCHNCGAKMDGKGEDNAVD